MPSDPGTSVDLGAFDPATADAVVEVLRRRGLPAWLSPGAARVPAAVRDDELTVLVPGDRRDEAFALLAAHMEEVASLARAGDPSAGAAVPSPPDEDGEQATRPIVLERFRRLGIGLATLLVPLLVVTLAAPRLPLGYGLVLLVAGMVAVVAWRNRGSEDG